MRLKKRRWYTYSHYLKSQHWKILRGLKLKESGYQCKRCGCRQHLEVHHKEYGHSWGDERLKDLEVLCSICHMIEHGEHEAANDPQYELDL